MSTATPALLNHVRDFKTRIIQKRRWVLRQCEKNNCDAERYLEVYVFLEELLIQEFQLDEAPLGWTIEVPKELAFEFLEDLVGDEALDKVIIHAIQKRILDLERKKAEAEKERILKEKKEAEREARRRERAKEREEAYQKRMVVPEKKESMVTDWRRYMGNWMNWGRSNGEATNGYEDINLKVTSQDDFEIIDF